MVKSVFASVGEKGQGSMASSRSRWFWSGRVWAPGGDEIGPRSDTTNIPSPPRSRPSGLERPRLVPACPRTPFHPPAHARPRRGGAPARAALSRRRPGGWTDGHGHGGTVSAPLSHNRASFWSGPGAAVQSSWTGWSTSSISWLPVAALTAAIADVIPET